MIMMMMFTIEQSNSEQLMLIILHHALPSESRSPFYLFFSFVEFVNYLLI